MLDQGHFLRQRYSDCGPLRLEPLAQDNTFLDSLGCLYQAQRVAWRYPEAIRGKRKGAQDCELWRPVAISQDDRSLRDLTECPAQIDLCFQPTRAAMGKPAQVQAVAGRPIGADTDEVEVGLIVWQQQSD
jgi:hypothetical protein